MWKKVCHDKQQNIFCFVNTCQYQSHILQPPTSLWTGSLIEDQRERRKKKEEKTEKRGDTLTPPHSPTATVPSLPFQPQSDPSWSLFTGYPPTPSQGIHNPRLTHFKHIWGGGGEAYSICGKTWAILQSMKYCLWFFWKQETVLL